MPRDLSEDVVKETLIGKFNKRCQIGAPTKIRKQDVLALRRTPVLKLQIGIDTLNQMRQNKEQVFEDDKLLI